MPYVTGPKEAQVAHRRRGGHAADSPQLATEPGSAT
jgi:hypothetical protein